MQVLSVRGNPFRSTPWFDKEATGWTFYATARLFAQPANRAKELLFSVASSWLAPRCKVDDRNNAQQRNPLIERLGRNLADYKSRNPIWSTPLCWGGFWRRACFSNSSQTSTGCGILTQSIPGFETETESRAAPLLLLLLLLLSSCFLPATSHRAPALLTHSWSTHPLPQHTHAHIDLTSKLTRTPWVSVSPSC